MKHTIYDDDRPENIRSTIGWTVAILTIGYILINAFVPNNDINIAVDVLVGVMATMALVYYLGAAVRAVWTGSQANTDYLIVGITLSWLSQDGQAWMRVVARLSQFDPAFLNSELFAPLKLLSVVAAVLHVIPRGAANGVVPTGDRVAVGIALLVAAVLSVGILTLRPDPRPMIQNAPIWMKDLFQTGERLVPGSAPT